MGVTQGAGLSLQWFRNQLATGTAYDDLTKDASTAPAGCEGLFWLPYLMGERTPHLDAYARGAWVGLTAKHTRAHLIRSVIEGVCFSQRDGLDIIEGMGVPVMSVRVSGGGARSGFWKQLLADILNKRVVTLNTQEGSAYGAALLAITGTGGFRSVEEACRTAIREVESVEPRASEAAAYAAAHRTYQSLYPALKPAYTAIAERASTSATVR
jgi:xylulokinase